MPKRSAKEPKSKKQKTAGNTTAGAATRKGPDSELHDLQERAGNQAVNELLQRQSRAAEQGARSPGRPMDEAARGIMEIRLGHDLGDVRLHTDHAAAQSAEALHAEAFTSGSDIILGQEHRNLSSAEGQQLLAHELAHVVQQRDGGANSPAPQHERQAEQVAAAVSAGRMAPVASAGISGIQRRAVTEEEGVPVVDSEVTPAEASGSAREREEEGSGFFSSLWSGLKSAGSAIWSGMKSVGEAVWGGLKAAGSAIWEGMKTLGGWIKTGAEAVWAAVKWVGKQLWDKIVGVFARIGRWVQKLPERVGRFLMGMWNGLLSLKPWSLDWWKSLAKAETWGNFLKWLGSRFVDLLEIAGIGEIYETAADFIKFNTRTLTSKEKSIASSIFGASIDLGLVRVDEYSVLGPSWSKREYTSFHTINGWGNLTDDTLIHELVHVWQYETSGAIYMPQAIHAQAWGEGYNYQGVAGLKEAKNAGKDIHSFNREQQGQIVQDFYRIKQGKPPYNPGGTAADLPLYAYFVKDVSTLSEVQLLAA